jgi:hypothetical protein
MEEGLIMSPLVDKIMKNMEELVEAHKEPERHEPSAKAQQRYVAKQTDRCYRCGDSVVYLLPKGMSTLCTKCQDYFRMLDENMNGEFMYFREMVAKINKGGE